MFYAGDELYGDDITSGPVDDFDAEQQAMQDEYDRNLSDRDRDWWNA